MKLKTVTIDQETRDILLRSHIDGNRLTLPEQLARLDYVRVAKAIDAAGGKWDGKQCCHLFPGDVRDTLKINGETTEVVNVKQTFQAFYTPDEVANKMTLWADIEPEHRVLEPSAGAGHLLMPIVMGIQPRNIVAVEINNKLVGNLRRYAGEVLCQDFLSLTTLDLGKFDRVLMNPPFSNPPGTDISHIRHASHFLKPGGRLVAICANGTRQRETLKPMTARWEELAPDAFKESGAGVNTVMLVIER